MINFQKNLDSQKFLLESDNKNFINLQLSFEIKLCKYTNFIACILETNLQSFLLNATQKKIETIIESIFI